MTVASLFPPGLRRRRLLLLACAVLIAVRAALPAVVRRTLETRASEALHARVTIGDVDLSLLRGGVVLEDVALRAAAAPASDGPLVAWKRFAVAVRWLPLVRRIVRLRTVELDRPEVTVDRLEDGRLNLTALVAGPAEPAAAEPKEPEPAEAATPSRWRVGVDRIVLRDGRIVFRDLMSENDQPIALAIDAVDVTGLSLDPGV